MTTHITTLVLGLIIVFSSIAGIAQSEAQAVPPRPTEYRYRALGAEAMTRFRILREQNGIVELDYGGANTDLMTRKTFEEKMERIP